jgi:hypothetical protein
VNETLQLCAIVSSVPHLGAILRAARDVGAPDWFVCAGAIRDVVWDLAHELAPTPARDIDVIFYDPHDLSHSSNAAVSAALVARAPEFAWEAVNQASVHDWYPMTVPPLRSASEGIATFPEIATCVGVRLEVDGSLTVAAPHGLSDLFACVCRHNPVRATREVYARRIATKGWQKRWPRLRVLESVPSRNAPT